MPTKRDGTRQVSFFLPDEDYQKLQDFISTNYTPEKRYGARSEVLTGMVSYCCTNPSAKEGWMNCLDNKTEAKKNV
jgi:hypothetical protein